MQWDKFLDLESTGVWLIDVQEKLFPHIARSDELLKRICFVLESMQALSIPVFVTEQSPPALGPTLSAVKDYLPATQAIYSKTTFSGYRESAVCRAVDQTGIKKWILIGIEAHICVLQTAKDLRIAGKEVVVLSDVISSRDINDCESALLEMRNQGIRVSCSESAIYEMIGDAKSRAFKAILPLVKKYEVHA